ncbi:zeta toxin family protein [Candidatus Saccharibacteria bacterium]|nr:zeta toxin family protein [Candidatus Saccharibacteria bacterium]
MTPLQWVKIHKKEIIERIISDADLTPSKKPIAIFMAGLPGAGKTELSQGLIRQAASGLIRIDMDELATMIEGYTPERADEFREAATRLLNELYDKVIHKKLDFILDGTFGSPKALQNIERVLKRGYAVRIAFACQDPKLAWAFTKAREKVERRSISEEGFLDSYYKTIRNLHDLAQRGYDGVGIDIFMKNNDNSVGEQYKDIDDSQIDEIVKIIYNRDRLKQYIES